MKKRLYVDYNATTPVDPRVQAVFYDALSMYGNPSSLYLEGRQAKEAIEYAREQCADCLNVQPDQLVFTSSGTEGNNQVLKQLLHYRWVLNEPVHLIVSAIEHSSVLQTAQYLETCGVDVSFVPVNQLGIIKEDAFKAAFKPHTKLVSIMMANNETGAIQDIPTLAKISHDHNVLFHSDTVQALGKCDMDSTVLSADFLTFSSHKCYAPKGVGLLYVKDDSLLSPLITGASHERKMRAGTENVPGIIALGHACSLLDSVAFHTHTSKLKKQFVTLISNSIDDVVFHSSNEGLPNTVNVSFLNLDGHALAINCDLAGINVSTGSACSVGAVDPSHVLTAMGVADEVNKSTLRFSFGKDTTANDIDYLSATLAKIVEQMRAAQVKC